MIARDLSRFHGLRLTAALCFAFFMLVPMAAWADTRLRVGVAEIEITPPEGFPMAGYYHERLATGTIDPLKAKALVLAQGDQQAAIVVCDLTAVSRDLCLAVRERASGRTGIAAEAIAVSATHSHTAPDYSRRLVAYLGGRAAGDDTGYPAQLIDRIVEAIVAAHERLEPVQVAAGTAHQEAPVSFNRRFLMQDGSVQTWKRLADPGVLRAAGPIDPEIGLVRFTAEDGKPRGVLTSFALHLDTVGGMQWSADYPFFIEQALRKQLGPDVISIFGLGCCGDINHVDPASSERNRTDKIGKALSATIEAALPQLRPVESDRLIVQSAVVSLPLQEVTPAEIERARQLLRVVRDGGTVPMMEHVAAYRTLLVTQFRPKTRQEDIDEWLGWGAAQAYRGVGDHLPVDVQTICIGSDVALVFLPGEMFVELGMAIKQGSPFRTTIVIELSNAVETAYIPTRAAYVGGGYEPTNSSLQPGGGELLVEAALRLLRDAASQR